MAATYEKITRQDFEDWLFERCPVFERAEDTAGVYLVPVSSSLAVKISTTLSSSDRTTRKGDGRCRMRFVTRYGLRRISCAAADRLDANRTKGWRENWASNLDAMLDLFKERRAEYTGLALQPQPEYAREWIERIESVPEWSSFPILVSIRAQLQDGKWLTPKQEGSVWKFVRPRAPRVAASRRKGPRGSMTDEQCRLLVAVERLEVEAQEADDLWLLDFCASLVKRLKSARDLTTKQRETLLGKLKAFNVKIPKAA